ncbi:threonine ammonia-lyase [Pseudoclavibacter endophyticus]|uniref:L-threonine dehydratase catabolic TdcB n=1 Tax=Pseudoclavibacter endophyticus TaxID=1778590 RepID=A0A6H9WNL3_9MICO|nr:threonine ammonia-lyase [Pseudoclavibacter endophyticus]KAB1649678.1 threonine ammonia-lyase [Pseudoclavibacter endophyticus]
MTEPPTAALPTLATLEAAREIVRKVITPTPVDSARFLEARLGAPVMLKCENMQRTGSYKIRGATYRLSQLTEAQRANGVVAASAGNHAQGVAYAARELGIAARIFMPVTVPLPKLEATQNYGAEIELIGDNVADALEAATAYAAEMGAELIHPYDHPDIITGQATLGLDVLDQVPDADLIVVPIGGGGLISGVAAAVRARREEGGGRDVRVIGVQAEHSAPFPPSLSAGRRIPVNARPTIADGIAVATPGELTFEYVRELVDDVVTVTEDDIARAILLLIERAKLVVEPAGATPVAAILAGKIPTIGTTVPVLTGGNIDPLMLEKVIAYGLTASDRYLKMVISLTDVPGELARISGILAEVNANVIEVLHTRHNKGLQITHVELEMSVETRGSEHVQRVLEALRRAGYRPRVRRDEVFTP